MRQMRFPNFGVNPKSYLYGDKLIDLAKYCDQLAEEYDIDISFTCGYAELARLKAETKNLFIFAQGADGIDPGRGMGHVLLESLREVGIDGVCLNHAERPMTTAGLAKAVSKCKELGIWCSCFADSAEEAKMIAVLHPDSICCEPTKLIGTGIVSDKSYRDATLQAIKSISPETIVSQAAGIRTGEDCYNAIMDGSLEVGGTSGIVCAEDPKKAVREWIEGTIRAINEKYDGKRFTVEEVIKLGL